MRGLGILLAPTLCNVLEIQVADKSLKSIGGVPSKRRLQSADDVRKFLADLVNRLNRNEIDVARAGRLGYLASILVGVLRDSDLETRIRALEARLAEATNER